MPERAVFALVVFGMLAPDAAPRFPLPREVAALRRPSNVQQTAASCHAARLRVRLPQEDAALTVDGQTIPGHGTTRDVARCVGAAPVNVVVTWQPNGYTTMTRSLALDVGADGAVADLTVAGPSDHAEVRYVPTPSYVVSEMIDLAGIRPDDVVFEPGCGDARVTIAAVKAGATHGVGIDLDPARVTESIARVREAGLERRIDIRLGDALSIPDIEKATVVFLYMGDEFNALIRPLLRRHLKPGARVVSHRFMMGDWRPDKTVSIPDESGTADVHLWVIK